LTSYYRKYVKGYARLVAPLFELTRKDVDFVWDMGCQQAFQALRTALVRAPILRRPDFKKAFCLDVDWSPKGVGAILSQKEGTLEKVVAYASKSLSITQRKFHPMEGECYALIWGIMHFKQYLYRSHFVVRTDHKPLEWLATVSDTHGRRGRWIDLLQDFSFQIVHRPGLRHTNVDALSRNPVGLAVEDDDFCEEVQDVGCAQTDAQREEEKLLFVRTGTEMEWYGIRRKDRELVKHQTCCFGINHSKHFSDHHLYMVDVLSEGEQLLEPALRTGEDTGENATMQASSSRLSAPRKRPQFYDKRQQLELVLEAQRLLETEEHGVPSESSDEKEECDMGAGNSDIWEDSSCMELLQTRVLPITIDPLESKRVRKRVLNYH
jgi:hypothetical protein